jgi:hypothetical protein
MGIEKITAQFVHFFVALSQCGVNQWFSTFFVLSPLFIFIYKYLVPLEIKLVVFLSGSSAKLGKSLFPKKSGPAQKILVPLPGSVPMVEKCWCITGCLNTGNIFFSRIV